MTRPFTKKYWRSAWERENVGSATQPHNRRPLASASITTALSINCWPHRELMRRSLSSGDSAGLRLCTTRWLWRRVKPADRKSVVYGKSVDVGGGGGSSREERRYV